MLDRLDREMRALIAQQRMMFLATSDGSGRCQCSFRAGPPGFVRVPDERRLAWPEYRGNGVLSSAGNISENPHVGLLFPGLGAQPVRLHVNGLADLTDDGAMRIEHPGLPLDPVPGQRARLWVTVFVDEAHFDAPAAAAPPVPVAAHR